MWVYSVDGWLVNLHWIHFIAITNDDEVVGKYLLENRYYSVLLYKGDDPKKYMQSIGARLNSWGTNA